MRDIIRDSNYYYINWNTNKSSKISFYQQFFSHLFTEVSEINVFVEFQIIEEWKRYLDWKYTFILLNLKNSNFFFWNVLVRASSLPSNENHLTKHFIFFQKKLVLMTSEMKYSVVKILSAYKLIFNLIQFSCDLGSISSN